MDAKTPLIGGSALADPFYTIKDVLEGDVRVLRGKFDEWQVRYLCSCVTNDADSGRFFYGGGSPARAAAAHGSRSGCYESLQLAPSCLSFFRAVSAGLIEYGHRHVIPCQV